MARKKPKPANDSSHASSTQISCPQRATQSSVIKTPLSFDTPKSSSSSLSANRHGFSVAVPSMPPPSHQTAQPSRNKTPLSSSLSLPPSSDDLPESEDESSLMDTPLSSTHSHSSKSPMPLEIKDSDDESEGSDQSLEDLANLLTTTSSKEKHRQQSLYQKTPVTPERSSKYQRYNYGLPPSPLTIQPKYKFDMSSLLSHAERDAAAEASSKRVKCMLDGHDAEESSRVTHSGSGNSANLAHGAILESVVAEAEDGTAHKVTRAIKRTEATVEESRWYFFETQSNLAEQERKKFPKHAVVQEWRRELRNSKARQHTFTSGFATDMVLLGRTLPDEVFSWLLQEVCFETNGLLRSSYANVLNESPEQVQRLVTPEVIQKMFQNLGGSKRATSVDEKIRNIPKMVDPYPNRDWAQLLSVLELFGHVGDQLNHSSRTQLAVLLLRLSADQLIFDNVDLLVTLQQTFRKLCRRTPADKWEIFCGKICKQLFNGIKLPTLRKQIVGSISSDLPRTHDLRRRLAMCFFFDDISYCEHSHNLTNLDEFLKRLESPTFETTPITDWREIRALIEMLDIAIDDGRCSKVDLSDREVEDKFNADVDDICTVVKLIMKMAGNDLVKQETKNMLEDVALRINETVRTKPKPREAWFDRSRRRGEQTFEAEKAGMNSFLSKMEHFGKGR